MALSQSVALMGDAPPPPSRRARSGLGAAWEKEASGCHQDCYLLGSLVCIVCQALPHSSSVSHLFTQADIHTGRKHVNFIVLIALPIRKPDYRNNSQKCLLNIFNI
ncbi:hypothetical protein ATANTOWER_014353 [Ataeniobius toweri]|uniref:Uncharacterized protein n=1 Tax=Ataeniobius toweri TaxID=208326 RepID=A0ABU7AYA6_9TELE|nr:hypothetical protein [Ataeniobius toweri]